MDLPHHGYRPTKTRARAPPPSADPLLFEDTSASQPGMNTQGYYTPGYNMAAPVGGPAADPAGNNLFADPMANAAMMYGSSLANQGKDMVNKEISRYMSMNKLKYFFAVDTKYVVKKLMLLMFPYTHQDWEVRYHRDSPLTPRHDVNAPDLYIPTMAFITYILLAGMALGIQQRFSPEVLGLCASTALVWVIIEVLVMLLGLYLLTVHTDLSTFDLLAYSGYKYVAMILTVLGGLLFGSDGYFVALAWSSCALMFFIVRSLKMKILSSLSTDSMGAGASAKPRLRLYITVATAAFQPIIIYWLTSHLVRFTSGWSMVFGTWSVMEANSAAIPPHTTDGSQPFDPSPPQTPFNVHSLLSLSPLSFPPSPTSLSPTTLESSVQSSPLSNSSSPCFDEHNNVHCRSSADATDQDDLTCLSWLHQRGSSLLPIQPLPKINQPETRQASAPADSLLYPSPNKPPYSFSSLIFMAIEGSPNKLLPVKGIYEWIVNRFPYYRTASGGWRNSVRHNLSLSKSFRRIQRDRSQSVGKGSLWCVCPEHRASLLEVLRKTHNYHSTNSNLVNMPALFEEDYGTSVVCDSDSLSHSLLMSAPSSEILTSDNPTLFEHSSGALTPDHEELVTMEAVEDEVEEEEEAGEGMEKDPLLDSGYIELHYYQCHQYQYLVLPGDAELDLESVEILQLDAEAQEAAGSLLDLAGGGHQCLY